MPTARPIIVIHSRTKKTSSPKSVPMTATIASVMKIETTASPMGISAATTAPKSTRRMRSAIGRPMRSPCSRSVADSSACSKRLLTSPTTSTSKPSLPSASSTTWMTSSTFSSASPSVPVIWTATMALLRSVETSARESSGLAASAS